VESLVKAVLIIVTLIVGGFAGFVFAKIAERKRFLEVEEDARKKEIEVKKQMQAAEKELELTIRDKELKMKQVVEHETDLIRNRLNNREESLRHRIDVSDKKTDILDHKEVEITGRERTLIVREKALVQQEKTYNALVDEWYIKTEKLSGLSAQEAKKQLMDSMISEARHESAKMVRQLEEEAREKGDAEAIKIIALSTQRLATDYIAEHSISVVNLPNEEMKGRIIGREGRNIRALEAATGVDFIVDDTPEAVILSAHNPVRRAVARHTLQILMADGRIHPRRIEEVVGKCEVEIQKEMQKAGEQATFDVGVHGIHPDLVKLIGRLKYRTSYSQNQLDHVIEVAFICGIMAGELGMNVKLARRTGLLHDIGKAVDHDQEGSHAVIGMELARKYNEHPDVVHAIGAHHEDIRMESPLDIITQVADALSGARPGARREMYESYINRLNDLEAIAMGFDGVEKTFAIQAGREIRVIVESDKVNDDDSAVVAREIAKKIETDMTYPGQIRVMVIREHRAIEYAK
jgi:ribonucrease Y